MRAESPSKLQSFNNELISTVANLVEKRESISQQLAKDTAQKQALQTQITQLNHDLTKLNSKIEKQSQMLEQCDQIIEDANNAYAKIVAGSKNLLDLVKKQSTEIVDDERISRSN